MIPVYVDINNARTIMAEPIQPDCANACGKPSEPVPAITHLTPDDVRCLSRKTKKQYVVTGLVATRPYTRLAQDLKVLTPSSWAALGSTPGSLNSDSCSCFTELSVLRSTFVLDPTIVASVPVDAAEIRRSNHDRDSIDSTEASMCCELTKKIWW